MTKTKAKRLRNGDEVVVVRDGLAMRGQLIGDPCVHHDDIFVDVETREVGFLPDVHHTELR